jgi:hypothetical protein
VTAKARSERTANLLMAHLDALARAAPRMPYAETKRLIEIAAMATSRAVTLELLAADRAAAIWREAHARHPCLPRVDVAFSARLAA